MNQTRRRLLLSVAGLAVGPRISLASSTSPSVGIIGGGIVGAAIAMYLAKAGADVTLFERFAPASGCSGTSFGWLNAISDDEHYRALRFKSLLAYRDLEKQLQLDISWGGYINWESRPDVAARLRARAAEFSRTGYLMREIDSAEFTEIAPNIVPGEFETAIFAGMDGHLDPVVATRKFLEQAKTYGARIIYPCEVTDLELSGRRLASVSTTTGQFNLDRLVIANGVDAPTLAAKAGFTLPLKHSPGNLAFTTPIEALTDSVNYGNGVHFKQMKNGAIVAGASFYPPDDRVHRDILREQVGFPSDAIRELHGEIILEKLGKVFPASKSATIERVGIGYRPLPEDGFPVVGYIPDCSDVYLAVTHSGITLAPIIARSVSREIVDDVPADALARYRPDRYA